MRTDSAAILHSAFSDSIRLGTLETFLGDLSADELNRLHYDFELWARDDQLPPEQLPRSRQIFARLQATNAMRLTGSPAASPIR